MYLHIMCATQKCEGIFIVDLNCLEGVHLGSKGNMSLMAIDVSFTGYRSLLKF